MIETYSTYPLTYGEWPPPEQERKIPDDERQKYCDKKRGEDGQAD